MPLHSVGNLRHVAFTGGDEAPARRRDQMTKLTAHERALSRFDEPARSVINDLLNALGEIDKIAATALVYAPFNTKSDVRETFSGIRSEVAAATDKVVFGKTRVA
jgi:hypothetical protein